jgi:hypothetical protein
MEGCGKIVPCHSVDYHPRTRKVGDKCKGK